MKQWRSVEETLDFAIGEEQAAAEFYTQLAAQARVPGMRQVFEGFAQEEMKHKTKLEAIKTSQALRPVERQVTDLRMAEYLVDVPPDPRLDYRSALVLAMKKEKAAFKLYSDLAESASDENVKAAFLALAQEEAKHKLRFEVEYDDMLAEN